MALSKPSESAPGIEKMTAVENPLHPNSSLDLKGLLAKVKEVIKIKFENIKELLTIFLVILILGGIIYNFFMKDEKDIPQEIFHQLYKLLASSAGVPHFASIEEKSWLRLKLQQNYTGL